VPIVIVSYVMMLAVVVQIAPNTSETAIALTNAVGWIGVRLDDIGTTLMIGLAPLFVCLAGKDDWVPKWLLAWSWVTAAVGLFSLAVLYVASLRALGFAIVPVGVLWTIAAGLVLIRHKPAQSLTTRR
jgi:hypothetical protein